MIKLKKLEIDNFRACESYSIELDNLGLCLICGPNGAGKSTVRTAIEYLLTDTTADEIPLDEFTRFNQGNCRLYLLLEKDGKDIIEITKYREHSQYGNSTILLFNGQDLSKTDRRETQKTISNVLGVSSYTLFSTSIFSSSSPSFVTSKESDRKDFLYEVQDISKYDIYLENTKKKCGKMEVDIEKFMAQISLCKVRLRDINESLTKIDIDIQKSILNKDDKLKQLNEELSGLTEKPTTELEETLHKVSIELETFKPADVTATKLNNEISDIKKYITDIEYREKSLERDINAVNNSTCPILNIDCSTLSERREEEKKKLLNDISFVLAEKVDKLQELTDKQTDFQKLTLVLSERDSLIDFMEETEAELAEIKSENKNILFKKDWVNKSIVNLLSEENPLQVVKEDLITKKKDTEKLLEKTQKDLTFTEECFSYYKFWKTGFSKKGIPNMKCEGFLSALQYETNNILSSLSSKYIVNISALTTLKSKEEREKVSYKILREDGRDYSYASFSGGEKQRIRLADMWAMHKLCSPLDILILDECLELSLDEEGKIEVMDMLKQLAPSISTVIVISHDSEIKDKFERVIRFEK